MSYIKTINLALKQVLDSSKKRLDFKNLGYLPRWLILLLDVFLCLVAIIVTSFIISNVTETFSSNYFNFTINDTLIIITNVFYFLLFRTYAGLIRHSSFIDAVKLFIASSSTFLTLLIVNYGFILLGNNAFISIPELTIYFSISFSFLFLFRVFVKQVFDTIFKLSNSGDNERALIFGTDKNAIAIANALKFELPSRFKIVGFINNDYKNKSKQILGVPIYFLKKKVSVLMRAYRSKVLILADKNISVEERIKLVDDCLDNHYKVYRAPIVSELENDEDLTKKIQNIQIEDLLERDPIKLENKIIAKELFQKIVLVTGGAGSIGSEIVRQISNYNVKKVIILDQAETPLYHIQAEIKKTYPKLDFEIIVADVSNFDKLDNIFKYYKPEIIYHAAAYKHVPLMEQNSSEAILVNVMGTKNLADLSLKYDIEKFVMISTDKAVNPSSVMGASKRIAEMYVQSLHHLSEQSTNLKISFITTRFGNVLDSNGSVVPLFKKQVADGGPLTITHPEIIRYFMTISEACQLVLEAAAMGEGGEIFMFDMGKAVKIIDLAKKIIRLSGYVPYKDIDIKIIGLRPGEKLYEELLNDKSTTLPTYHEKIMIAKVDSNDYNKLSEEVSILIDYAKEFNTQKIVSQMKVIVPEFKSMNSKFQVLDIS